MTNTPTQTVYKISEEDKTKIKTLFNRKGSIRELMDSATENQALYEKLRDDYIEVNEAFNQWFIDFEINYQALGAPGHFWDVDFNNSQVILRKAEM